MERTRESGDRRYPSAEGQSERRAEAQRASVVTLPVKSEDEFERWLIAALEWERRQLQKSGVARPVAGDHS